jgi:hypothetical protein
MTVVEAQEIEGTSCKHFRVSATWEFQAVTTPTAGTIAGNPAQVGYTFSSSPASVFMDSAPLRAILALPEGGNTPAPKTPFAHGDVNAERIDGEVTVRGLDYTPPAPNIEVSISIPEEQLSTGFIRGLLDASYEGVLNTDEVTVAGLPFRPLELLFVDCQASYSVESGTSLILGFAAARRTVSLISSPNTSSARITPPWLDTPVPYQPAYLAPGAAVEENIFDNQPNSKYLVVSGHDFIWRFRDTGVDKELKNSIKFISIHRLHREVAFGTLFGGTTI